MNDNFDDFTESARFIVGNAIGGAQVTQVPPLEIHLLISLLGDAQNSACRLLAECGVSLTPLLALANRHRVTRPIRKPTTGVSYDLKVEQIIAGARAIVAQNDGLYVGTHHLLAAMVQYESGVTVQLLQERGADVGAIRKRLVLRIAEIVDTNERPYIEGADVRIWGAKAEIDALMQRANDLKRPIDDLIWEAIWCVWLKPEDDPPEPLTAKLRDTKGASVMPDKFEKFTERSRKVFSLAQEEAQGFNHNYIGTEHLLLGLVREGDGIAARVLLNLGVSLPKVRSSVEFITWAWRWPRGW